MADIPDSRDDSLMQALADYRKALEDRRVETMNIAHAELAHDKERLARALSFAKNTGLARALLVVLAEIRHYPAWWAQGEKFGGSFVHGVTDIEGTSGNEEAIIGITFHGVRFQLVFHDQGAFVPSDFAAVSLQADGRLVLRMDLKRHLPDELDEWECHQVTALEPGIWATTLLDLEHAILTKQNESYARTMGSMVHQSAKNLPPIQDLPPASTRPYEPE